MIKYRYINIKFNILISILSLFVIRDFLFMTIPEADAHDRYQTTRYAEKWWDGRNTGGETYFDDQWPFHAYSADCANFVSQCLIAGGFNLMEGGYADDYIRYAIVDCDLLFNNLNWYQWNTQHTPIEYVDGNGQTPNEIILCKIIIINYQ